jgi:hypothetical protein
MLQVNHISNYDWLFYVELNKINIKTSDHSQTQVVLPRGSSMYYTEINADGRGFSAFSVNTSSCATCHPITLPSTLDFVSVCVRAGVCFDTQLTHRRQFK